MQTIGQMKLREALALPDMDQSRLAKECGVAQNNVSRWVNGQSMPSLPSFLRARAALAKHGIDLHPEDFLSSVP